MWRFLKNIIFFTILGLVVGEVISRTFVLTSDIPRRIIDNTGIQRYQPNQTGEWHGGDHSWKINEQGWPGDLPNSYENLITIIGDSYIENFMNPDSCHQYRYLKKELPKNNFMEASRSGVSFIEAMEIAKQLDSLKPNFQLIYLHDSDFNESIVQFEKHNDITQVDLANNKVVYGKMKATGAKAILYNWKFIYYLYNRFPFARGTQNNEEVKVKDGKGSNKQMNLNRNLLTYVKKHYDTEHIVLVFRPESNSALVSLAEESGFHTLHLRAEDTKSWSFDYDSHWTCYGHQKAAFQVASFIKHNSKNPK